MLGIDIVAVNRIKKNKTDRWALKILSDDELVNYHKSLRKQQFIATHFAAKEALAKSIGTGVKHEQSFKKITVAKTKAGKPYFSTHPMYELAITHEEKYVIAVVIKNVQ
jgi:holo-[acyl-carrier protein] synthase